MMKTKLFIPSIAILSACLSFGQHPNGTFTGTSSGFKTAKVSVKDPIAQQINQVIKEDLSGKGFVNTNFELSKTSYGYQTLVPLKSEQGVLVIWADYLFSQDGKWLKTSIKMSEGDCEPSECEFCNDVNDLKEGYYSHFNALPEDMIQYCESPDKTYFKVIHEGHWTTFDKEGNYIE